MPRQQTIARPFSCSGVGVHTGKRCTLTAYPAPEGAGISFQRLDLPDEPVIPACVTQVQSTLRCTRLGRGDATVSTIEHLMSALRGLGIDNCRITMDGPEVPIADGSADLFCREIAAAGIVEQSAERRVIRLSRPVWVSDGARHVVALPADELRVSFTFTNDKAHPALSDEFAEFVVTPEVFAREIAPARTIGWLAEVQALQAQGLIKGGSIDIAVVIGEDRVLTPRRFANELVRHKVLDTIGDLALVGHLLAHVICIRSGHEMNARLGQAIWEAVEAPHTTVL